ncbi:MAG: phosphoribosylglycinamide formyltransferase [Peptococcaceae bacterium]|jgi:phosphoribosylglycinamide formyltransferase-1|nr:phosphoribosylglycinamide formyltransferase [Peptococcaceae bacterium]
MLEIIVMASGRGSNLIAIQEAVESGMLKGNIRAVISNKKEAPALIYAESKGIRALWFDPDGRGGRLEYERKILAEVNRVGSDCIVLAGYTLMLGIDFIRDYGKPIFNIHPALLPSFPGLTAQKDAVEYGVKCSGCTVHFVDEGMDTGPIIAQRAVPVLEYDDEESLSARILEEEHKLYPEVLTMMAQGRIHLLDGRVFIDLLVR